MRWTGAALLILSALLILGYLTYLMFAELLLNSEAPLALRIGVPAGYVGALILLASVLVDRFRQRPEEKRKKLDEVKP